MTKESNSAASYFVELIMITDFVLAVGPVKSFLCSFLVDDIEYF